ncbi:MAG TPA: HAD family hydrolase [Actinomycetota bacterium]|nr:HAD family hydrolase [Actinomycetota bacterium]
MSERPPAGSPIAILFDVDGTLIVTGGAGTRSWRWAFEQLHGIPADIGEFSEAGMTDPVVARRTFRSVIGREPDPREMARLLAAYLERLPEEVESSESYQVLPGAEDLLRRLCEGGLLLGIVTGALEAAAHIKLARARLNRFFPFGGYGSDSDDRTELTRRAIERAGSILGRTLAPARMYVVGDTPKDIDAARGVGAVAVGVASGHYSMEALSRARADIVLPSLRDPMPGLEWASRKG